MSKETILAQLQNANKKMAACRAAIAAIQKKIERLQETLPKVQEIHYNIEILLEQITTEFSNQAGWSGENQRQYIDHVATYILEQYLIYCKGVYEVQESIEREIVRLENELEEQKANLSRLADYCSLSSKLLPCSMD